MTETYFTHSIDVDPDDDTHETFLVETESNSDPKQIIRTGLTDDEKILLLSGKKYRWGPVEVVA